MELYNTLHKTKPQNKSNLNRNTDLFKLSFSWQRLAEELSNTFSQKKSRSHLQYKIRLANKGVNVGASKKLSTLGVQLIFPLVGSTSSEFQPFSQSET